MRKVEREKNLEEMLVEVFTEKEFVPALYMRETDFLVREIKHLSSYSAYNFFNKFSEVYKKSKYNLEIVILGLSEFSKAGDLKAYYILMHAKDLIKKNKAKDLEEMLKRDGEDLSGYRIFKRLKDDGTLLRSVYYPDFSILRGEVDA